MLITATIDNMLAVNSKPICNGLAACLDFCIYTSFENKHLIAQNTSIKPVCDQCDAGTV